MSNLQALGYFMDYCNRNSHEENVKNFHKKGMAEIMSSAEGRFRHCTDANDVLTELGYSEQPHYNNNYVTDKVYYDTTSDNEWKTEQIEDGSLRICAYLGSKENVKVPSYIEGKAVSEIGAEAFEWNEKIKNIHVSEGIKSIGADAFLFCQNMISVSLPESLSELDGCFGGCSKLKSIYIPKNIKKIGAHTFSMCDSLMHIEVSPDNSTYTMNNGMLLEHGDCIVVCEKRFVGHVSIPKGIKGIEVYAFSGCNQITSISLPDGVKYIDENAFNECTELRSITIPDSMLSIGANVFNCCEKLTEISIPASCKIGKGAFSPFSKEVKVVIR